MSQQNWLELNELQQKYGPKGLYIFVFFSNQFYRQAPGTGDEIINTMRYARPGDNFVFAGVLGNKVDVNGPQEDPLFTYLKTTCGAGVEDPMFYFQDMISWAPLLRTDIVWNWTKFLVDRKGFIYRRYVPTANPLSFEQDIVQLLMQ